MANKYYLSTTSMVFILKPYEQRFPWTLDWNLLRTFVVVVEQGGITRAANFLGVTQPTISSALKRLEDTVDQRLVNRHSSQFAVTEAGKILFRESSSVFGTVSQIPGLIREARSRVTGHVSMVMASHVVSPHFDALFAEFDKNHPDATYSIAVAESSEVLGRVREKRATMGLCLMREQDRALDAKILFREQFGLFCGPSHRLFGKEGIALSELKGESSVSFQTDVESGPLHSVTLLREQALLKPGLKGISANLPEVRRMIVAGIGIGALPIHVARKDVDAGSLWRLPPYSKIPVVDVFFVTNPRRSMNPAESKLIASINNLIQDIKLEKRTYH